MSAAPQDPVVTGLGALTPVGLDAARTWEALVAGRSGIAAVTCFDASRLPTRIAGEVTGFDPVAVLGEKRARRTARFSQLAIAAAREAVADAGLRIADAPDRVAVAVNTAVAGVPETQANVEGLVARGPREVSPFYVPTTIPNMPACEVAIDLGAHGPVSASALACASGTYALLEARRLILGGEADVVIAGGTDAGICEVMLAGLSNMGPLSSRNDEPERASRPFDADRDGFVFGEGAVVLVVESAEHARTRGARTYGRVAGAALTGDAFHMSAPERSGAHAARAVTQALERAGVAPGELDYVCAHGTGTRANDAVETRALHAALGSDVLRVPVSSPKSMVGHLIGAAGALSAMVCLLAMRDGVVPPTINLQTPDPECELDHVAMTARRTEVRAAAANAFGFGGQNCVVVLRAAEAAG
ncbi:beta-ketoacyl-ACP synthase II [Baekduia soli]|uniref:3-oxoacyl-[acyl-carrier-protein] synthase 2 n=1 Tax=Baekduia soli TaxID=496014 RepID=A0A5B8U6W2_9ACTN|nr:beta-ketoacyl-ACP synthase II [Baekduia soli]QEC48707.1 beta-ketoacyl-ACP synthase II [Baekduia soli]